MNKNNHITNNKASSNSEGWLALSPLVVLLTLCIISAIISKSHSFSLTGLLIISIVYALIITRYPANLSEKVAVLSKDVINGDILTMLWIFLFAGIFSYTAKDIGAIEVIADLTYRLFPGRFLLCGLFLSSCFVSLVTGTSLGTVITLMPIVVSISNTATINPAITAAAITSGAFFGDNVSLISDTSVAAVQTLACDARQKFLYNLRLALPAVIITTIIYFFICPTFNTPGGAALSFDIIKGLPFLLILALSFTGLHVLLVLFIGIIANGIIGFLTSANTLYSFLSSISNGANSMGEMIIMTILCCCLLSIIRHNGGLRYIVERVSQRIKNGKFSEFFAAFLVCVVNLCTINNTVAIITTGPIAKELSDKFLVKNYRMASIIDVFACITQGLLPFSAQVIYAASLSQTSILLVILNSYFLFALALTTINAIISVKIFHIK